MVEWGIDDCRLKINGATRRARARRGRSDSNNHKSTINNHKTIIKQS